MSHNDVDRKSGPEADNWQGGAQRGPRLISIAFVTALVFGPIVIGTGLLTTQTMPSDTLPGISLSALRQSFDADPSSPSFVDGELRGSKAR